ncbi:MAG: hypothetical protein K8R90_06330 [Candidatus Cloacimonetes bacterium]|nr:hypothetical protein [Candidatus Cloacimonadota bacterium]
MRLTIIALFIILFASTAIHAQIYSTLGGGVWDDPLTWMGGVVPTAGSNVVIQGPVSVNGLYQACNDIAITADGVLQPISSSSYTFTVNGDMGNNGAIQNNGTNLYLDVNGDITNNGTITNHKITLVGSSAQTVSSSPDQPYEPNYFVCSNTGGAVAGSGLEFYGYEVDFNGRALDLSGHDFTWASRLVDIDIIGAGATLVGLPDSYIDNATVSDVTIDGTVSASSSVTFTGSIVVAGILQGINTGHVSFTVDGDLVNNGAVRNDPSGYLLTINAYGDVINNGTWDIYRLYLLGASAQTLSCPAGQPFEVNYFTCNNTSGAVAGSDLEIIGTGIDFNGYTLDLAGGPYDLTWNGGLSEVNLVCATGSRLVGEAGSFINNSDANDVILDGTISVSNSVTFTGPIVVAGILQGINTGHVSFTVDGDLVNNGAVRNDPSGYNLTINAYGDVINNGTWDTYRLYLQGAAAQTLSSPTRQPLYITYFTCNNTSGAVAGSDLEIIGTGIDFNGYTLDLAGGPYDLTWNGGLSEVNLVCATGSRLVGEAGSFINNSDANDVILDGTISVSNSVTFTGPIVVAGILQGINTGHVSFTVDGDLVNNGAVRNDPSGYNLTINAYGDVINNGTWDTYRLYMLGASAQILSSAANEPLYITNFTCSNTGGVIADSDLEIIGSGIDFNGHTLDLADGPYDLTWNGGLTEVNLVCATGSRLVGETGSFINNSDANDVILDGTITVASSVTFTGYIEVAGILQGVSTGAVTLTIDGDLVNNGAVRNDPGGYNLTINAYGDVINNGTWNIYRLNLLGAAVQTLSSSTRQPLNLTYLNCNNTGGVIAGSDIAIVGATVDFNNRTFDFTAGYSLDIDANLIETIVPGGAGTVVTGHDNYWYIVQGSDLTLDGIINFRSSVELTDIVNNGILQNATNTNYTLTVHGDLANHGAIRNNPAGYNFSIRTDGDISNYGVWNIDNLYLNGAQVQAITSPDSTLVMDDLIDEDASSDVFALSDLSFQNTSFDFNGAVFVLYYPLNRFSYDLTLNNCHIDDAIVFGGPGVEMHNLSPTRLSYVDIFDLTLYGTVDCQNGVEFQYLTNEGVVQNYSNGNYTIELHGDTVNNGTFQNNPAGYNLYVELYGDFENNGIVDIYRLECEGDTPQTFDTFAGTWFTLSQFTSHNTADTLWWNGDMHFVGPAMDFNGDTVILDEGVDFSLQSGYIREVTMSGSGDFTMGGGAYLYLSTFEGFTFYGETCVRSDVVLRDAVISDTLRNDPIGSYTVVFEGDCANHGVIHAPAYNFYIDLLGNLVNTGTIDINRIDIQGAAEQTVHIDAVAPINTETRIYSDIGSVTWYYNGAPLGPVGNYITLTAIDMGVLGVYNGESGGNWTRNINLISSSLETPQNLLISCDDSGITLVWDEVADATSYILETSDAPDGVFIVLEPVIIDPTPGDGTVTWFIANPGTDTGYYRVKSVN